MTLFLRTTLIACLVSVLAVTVHSCFLARVTEIHFLPEESSSWSTEKKEVYRQEHPNETLSGTAAIARWFDRPSEWLEFFAAPVFLFLFPFAWIAAFLGSLLQRRRFDKLLTTNRDSQPSHITRSQDNVP